LLPANSTSHGKLVLSCKVVLKLEKQNQPKLILKQVVTGERNKERKKKKSPIKCKHKNTTFSRTVMYWEWGVLQ